MILMRKKTAALIFLTYLVSLAATGIAQDNTSVWDEIFTEEQAERGEYVYTEACIACHGLDLGGNSNSPGLTGMSFMFLWEGRSVGELFEKIRAEMPTDRPGQLPLQDYLDVTAYILLKNAFPAGDEELPATVETLSAIKIVPKL